MTFPILVTYSRQTPNGDWSKHAAFARDDGTNIVEFHAVSARVNRVNLALMFGGEDREMALRCQLFKLPMLSLSMNGVTKSAEEENVTEYGFTFIEDVLFIDWHRKGGMESHPTVTLNWMNILFGDAKIKETVLETRDVILNSAVGSAPVKITLTEYIQTRPRLLGFKRWVNADVDLGENGVADPTDDDPDDRLYRTSFPAQSIDDAIEKISTRINQHYKIHHE